MRNVLGVQLYTVRELTQTLKDFVTTIKKGAQIGYSAVQISAIGPLDPGDVAKICDDNGIIIAGTHIRWDDFCNKIDEVIAKHKSWKCTHSAVGSLPVGYYTSGVEGIERFIDELGPVTEKLHREGIDFSYHNHNHEFTKDQGKSYDKYSD